MRKWEIYIAMCLLKITERDHLVSTETESRRQVRHEVCMRYLEIYTIIWLVAIPHRKRAPGKCRNRWEKNVKMGVTNHTVKVWTAFNHLRKNQITKLYKHCGKQQVGASDLLNNCRLFKEDLLTVKVS